MKANGILLLFLLVAFIASACESTEDSSADGDENIPAEDGDWQMDGEISGEEGDEHELDCVDYDFHPNPYCEENVAHWQELADDGNGCLVPTDFSEDCNEEGKTCQLGEDKAYCVDMTTDGDEECAELSEIAYSPTCEGTVRHYAEIVTDEDGCESIEYKTEDCAEEGKHCRVVDGDAICVFPDADGDEEATEDDEQAEQPDCDPIPTNCVDRCERNTAYRCETLTDEEGCPYNHWTTEDCEDDGLVCIMDWYDWESECIEEGAIDGDIDEEIETDSEIEYGECDPACEEKLVCHPETNTCVECVVDSDCGETEHCGEFNDEENICLQEVLYVADRDANAILRFNAVTGEFIDALWGESPVRDGVTTTEPHQLGLDFLGRMYIVNFNSGNVDRGDPIFGGELTRYYSDPWMEEAVDIEFDKLYSFILGNDHQNMHVADLETGEHIVEIGYGRTCPALEWPHDMTWHKSAKALLITNDHQICGGHVHLWDMRNVHEAYIIAAFGKNELQIPTGVAYGPDGNIYVGSWWDQSVYRYDGNNFDLLGVYIDENTYPFENPPSPIKFEFRPDGKLYMSTWQGIMRFEAATGEFIDNWIPVNNTEHPEGLLDEPIGMLWMDVPVKFLESEEGE